MDDKRLIEETIPLEDISKESAREKSIRQGHISTLHIWWARRPLVACRAAVFGSLVIPSKISKETLKKTAEITKRWLPEYKKVNITDKELADKELYHFMRILCTWEASNNKEIIEHARLLIRESHDGKIPKVLDPFAGGGSIPLEALRLGCETYANELNPIAHIIELCTLVYPQKYGKEVEIEVEEEERSGQLGLGTSQKKTIKVNKLAEDVKKWANWIITEAQKELIEFYPNDPDGSIPVGYIWARTIPCQNPNCGVYIPLLKQLWLLKTGSNNIAINFKRNGRSVIYKLETVKDSNNTHYSQGTTARASATCPICSSTVDAKTVRKISLSGKMKEELIAVATHKLDETGIKLREVNEKDKLSYHAAKEHLEKLLKSNSNIVSQEKIPLMSGTFNVPIYGINKWTGLFNSRQLLTMIVLTKNIKIAISTINKELNDKEYSTAIVTYLSLGLNRLATYMNNIARWRYDTGSFERIFDKQALPMIWDYGEVNPFSGRRGQWDMSPILNVIENLSTLNLLSRESVSLTLGNATDIHKPKLFFNAVVTDPPYYNAVPYADLSDFFYIWMKEAIGNLYPDIFRTPLTPKSQEIVEMKSWDKVRYANKDKIFYERELTKSFIEMGRVSNEKAIVSLMFAHKSTSAWEALLKSIVDSGLLVSSSWPINMESSTRMRAHDSASLSNTIVLICRKRIGKEIGYFDDIKNDLKSKIKNKLDEFWNNNIRGADFFISSIGPSIEVFGKYSQVKKLSGEVVTVSEFLNLVREEVTNYALQKILTKDVGSIDAETRFYILWRWAYNSLKVPFDDARILAQAIGVEVDELMSKTGVLKKAGENVELLGPLDIKVTKVESIIDALHKSCQLWAAGKKQELAELLGESGKIEDENFWSTAQALSEVLPDGDKEKQLLQGLLASKSGIADAIKQERLF